MISNANARPAGNKIGLLSSPASAERHRRQYEHHESNTKQNTLSQSFHQLRPQKSSSYLSVPRDSSVNTSLAPLPKTRTRGDIVPREAERFCTSNNLPSSTTIQQRVKTGEFARFPVVPLQDPSTASALSSKTDNDENKPTSAVLNAYNIWDRVTTAAASILTVDISNARANKIGTLSDEETLPGHESQLTRAMKSYHLEKARDPSDLPEWLFTEDEVHLALAGASRFKSAQTLRTHQSTLSQPGTTTLREIYHKAAAANTSKIVETTTHRHRVQLSADIIPSRAANRLKALRDEKRSALGIRGTASSEPGEDSEENVFAVELEGCSDEHCSAALRAQRQIRPGLPSGPRIP